MVDLALQSKKIKKNSGLLRKKILFAGIIIFNKSD